MDRKRIGKALLFPSIPVMAILTVISAASLITVFVNGWSETIPAYVAYAVSFYTLSVIVLFCAMVLPKRYRRIKQRVYEHPLGNRYMTDAIFRTHVSLFLSLGINLLYVGVNVLSFCLYRSMWFVVLAVYYTILSVMRFLLVRYVRTVGIGRDRMGELRRSVLCAWILLTVNFALSGSVLMILYQNKGYEYHGVLIYVMASYTFYLTTHAIIGLLRQRKYNSPVMKTARVISLSAALVSMLSLETAMFSQFGQEMAQNDQRLMIALTGAGISAATIVMSIHTIVTSNREIREAKELERGE